MSSIITVILLLFHFTAFLKLPLELCDSPGYVGGIVSPLDFLVSDSIMKGNFEYSPFHLLLNDFKPSYCKRPRSRSLSDYNIHWLKSESPGANYLISIFKFLLPFHFRMSLKTSKKNY